MRKIIDTSSTISKGGRADRYNYGLKAKFTRYSKTAKDPDGLDMKKILDGYRLKGFEFGNWVSTEERNTDVAACENSLRHLSIVMSTKNVGINGNVGIAFGARGQGGAKAHYEPCTNMINLTRKSGADSLAHEYGHALDFIFGAGVDQHKLYTSLSGGHSTACGLTGNVGGQFRAYMNLIVDSIKNSDSYSRLSKSGEYWHRRTEIFARFFEQYVCYVLKSKHLRDDLLTKKWDFYCTQKAYLSEDDFMKIVPYAHTLVSEMGHALCWKGAYPVKATPYPSKLPIEKKRPRIVSGERNAKPKHKAAASK